MANDVINDTSLELENKSNDDLSSLKYQISQLTTENDVYKQSIHSLQSKVQIDLGIQNELHETIDNMEKTIQQLKNQMDKKINEIEEKNGVARLELRSRLGDMEQESGKKSEEIRELQEKLNETNKLLSLESAEKSSNDLSIHDETILRNSQQLEELMEKLLQEENARQCLEHTINSMSKEEYELKTILQLNRDELAEKNEMLKTAQEELQECRIELETMKNVPASEECKGNSLFAEVEDRRKKLLNQMAHMKTTYYDAKRCLTSKDNEIKALKIELAALLNKQKDDADNCIQENGDLLDKYKDRTLELENKLAEQQKKYRKLEIQKQPTDNSFSYFQSLLDVKRKENEELEAKLENSSVQLLLQEEMKLKINRQMRYWRNKAMSCEAQMETIKFQLQNNSSIDKDRLLKIFQRDCAIKTSPNEKLFMDLSEKSPPIVDETVLTLDELIQIPKRSIQDIDHLNEQNVAKHSRAQPIDDISFVLSDSNDKSSEMPKFQDNDAIRVKQSSLPSCNVKTENEAGTSINDINENGDSNRGKEKKTLRFVEGTVDPEPRKLRRQNTPKYPIFFVTNKPTDQ